MSACNFGKIITQKVICFDKPGDRCATTSCWLAVRRAGTVVGMFGGQRGGDGPPGASGTAVPPSGTKFVFCVLLTAEERMMDK
jgi:hypothetical protein